MTQASARGAACVSVDLDTLHHYRAIHGLKPRDDGRDDVTYTVGLARALALFDELGVASTLFVIGQDVAQEGHRQLLSVAHEQGHELANHTFEHRYDLRDQPSHIRVTDIAKGESAIEQITGLRPVGFRAPGYNIDDAILETLQERRYLYDSSIFACPPYYAAKAAVMAALKLRGTPSFSAMTLPQTLLAPITPYYPTPGRLWRPDRDARLPLELPMCVVPGLRLPVIGTSLHLFGWPGFKLIYPSLKRAYQRCLQLEFHTIDFIDAQDLDDSDVELIARQPDLRVPWANKRALYRSIFELISQDYTFRTMASVARAWPKPR